MNLLNMVTTGSGSGCCERQVERGALVVPVLHTRRSRLPLPGRWASQVPLALPVGHAIIWVALPSTIDWRPVSRGRAPARCVSGFRC